MLIQHHNLILLILVYNHELILSKEFKKNKPI
jgi:hypothetical protein